MSKNKNNLPALPVELQAVELGSEQYKALSVINQNKVVLASVPEKWRSRPVTPAMRDMSYPRLVAFHSVRDLREQMAQGVLKDYLQYRGPDGRPASGHAGFNKMLNRAFCREFGAKPEDLPESDIRLAMEALTEIQRFISQTIRDGLLNRDEVNAEVKQLIRMVAKRRLVMGADL